MWCAVRFKKHYYIYCKMLFVWCGVVRMCTNKVFGCIHNECDLYLLICPQNFVMNILIQHRTPVWWWFVEAVVLFCILDGNLKSNVLLEQQSQLDIDIISETIYNYNVLVLNGNNDGIRYFSNKFAMLILNTILCTYIYQQYYDIKLVKIQHWY